MCRVYSHCYFKACSKISASFVTVLPTAIPKIKKNKKTLMSLIDDESW